MLADDEVRMDDLVEEDERALQVAERGALTDVDPNNVASGPADVEATPAHVFLLVSCSSFD